MKTDREPRTPTTRSETRRVEGRPRHVRFRPATIASIALGGAMGTVARVAVEKVVPAGPGLPWGTLLVNIVGSFALGAAVPLLSERLSRWRSLWPLFATGYCGSFTTFSTFAVEVDLRVRSGNLSGGAGYALVSVTIGLAALLVGMATGRSALGYTRQTAPGNDATSGRR